MSAAQLYALPGTVDLKARVTLLGWRLGAYALDAALLFAFVLASQYALVATRLHPYIGTPGADRPSPWALHGWVFLSTSLPFFLYFAIGFATGATPMQRLLRVRVRGADGARLGALAAPLRALVLLLPFELNHTLMFHAAPWAGGSLPLFVTGIVGVWLLVAVYVVLPLLRVDGRSVHDLAAGSAVSHEA